MKAVMARPAESPLRVQDDPHYRPHAERLSALRDQLAGYDKQITRLEAAGDETGREHVAQAIADGRDVREIEPRADPRTVLKIAQRQREDVAQGIKIVEAREREAFTAARARYFDQLRVEYVTVANEMADALVALGKAQEAATAMQDRVRAAGGGDWPAAQGPIGLARVGTPQNQHSLFARWLVAAIAADAVDEGKVPAHWRQSWGMLAELAAHGDDERMHAMHRRVRNQSVEASAPQARARAGGGREGW